MEVKEIEWGLESDQAEGSKERVPAAESKERDQGAGRGWGYRDREGRSPVSVMCTGQRGSGS